MKAPFWTTTLLILITACSSDMFDIREKKATASSQQIQPANAPAEKSQVTELRLGEHSTCARPRYLGFENPNPNLLGKVCNQHQLIPAGSDFDFLVSAAKLESNTPDCDTLKLKEGDLCPIGVSHCYVRRYENCTKLDDKPYPTVYEWSCEPWKVGLRPAPCDI